MTLENPFFVVKDEVCKALNKNRGLYGRWSELQNVGITSPTGGGLPMSGSATAPPISRTEELDWTTTELRKALRSIEWDLDDLEDTIYILFHDLKNFHRILYEFVFDLNLESEFDAV
ncbi:syntaxin-like protein [Lasius niger]|uniref:Syntaxin-like protein n=1 Tax=Lasius niger TaxID=67767 RepID=A0A0J7KXQ3_LASNI|nr:syntaxin-like protein [Lasius niger]